MTSRAGRNTACFDDGRGDSAGGVMLSIESLTRRFSGTAAVDDISFEAGSGECIVVLGASGCGKSTLLRLVAGLDRPDEGCIRLGGSVVSDDNTFLSTEQRGVGVVFQSYALWPHLDVAAHARFPLDAAGVRGVESRRRVDEALEMVGMQGMAKRRPAELSGGQRQRVALARCLAQQASLILMDEPLANLDPHLRSSMEHEIARVRRETGATMLYITHDQREAMALADRIVVLDEGRLRQLATPEALYAEPADLTVASFIGTGSLLDASLLTGHADEQGKQAVRVGSTILTARSRVPSSIQPGATSTATASNSAVRVLVRPENVSLSSKDMDSRSLKARVVSSTYRGDHHEVELQLLEGGRLLARSAHALEQGSRSHCVVHDAWIVPER